MFYAKLKAILYKDIEFLEQTQRNKNKHEDIYKFLDSLIGAKLLIIKLLPPENILPNLPKNHNVLLHSYKKGISTDERNYSFLLDLFRKMEEDQLTFIQKSYNSNKLSEQTNVLIETVIEIYKTIVQQLTESSEDYNLIPIIL